MVDCKSGRARIIWLVMVSMRRLVDQEARSMDYRAMLGHVDRRIAAVVCAGLVLVPRRLESFLVETSTTEWYLYDGGPLRRSCKRGARLCTLWSKSQPERPGDHRSASIEPLDPAICVWRANTR